MPLLSAKNIVFSYPNTNEPALSEFSIDLFPGEMLGVSGENGSGKTTLALILAGILQPNAGNISFFDTDLFSEEGQKIARKKIGFIFQDPACGFLTTSVEREIAFGLENLAVPHPKLKDKVDEYLRKFDLEKFRKEPFGNLSGGMMERLAIASATAMEPSLLILDEPDSFLDYKGKVRLWSEIKSLRKRGVSIVLITQSKSFLEKADRKIVLTAKKKTVPTDERSYLDNDYFVDSDRIILELRSVKFSYGDNLVLRDINLQVLAGECIAILGPSGSGKTTLSRVASGLFEPDSGEIKNFGRVAVGFQFPARQLFAETVLDDVAFGPKCMCLENPIDLAKSALMKIKIEENLYGHSPHALSDGEQRRIGIAGVLAIKPACVFFDEPVATLDDKGKEDFVRLIGELKKSGMGICLITHDLMTASRCAEKCIVLDNGVITYSGKISKIIEDKTFRNSMGLGVENDIFEEE